jgi:hypothetical protein
MEEMRRIVISAVAVGYGLSFVAVCLAACLMGPMVADHACCAGDDGIRASDQDCCSVTPGISHGGSAVAPAAPAIVHSTSFAAGVLDPVSFARPAAASPSPPLVLRV